MFCGDFRIFSIPDIYSVGNHKMYRSQIAPLVSRLPRLRRCRMNHSSRPRTPFPGVDSSLSRHVFSRRPALLRSGAHALRSDIPQPLGANPGRRGGSKSHLALAPSGLFQCDYSRAGRVKAMERFSDVIRHRQTVFVLLPKLKVMCSSAGRDGC